MFDELDQYAAGGSRMQEGDLMAPGPLPWLRIDEFDADRFGGLERPVYIVRLDGDMVDPVAVLLEIACDRYITRRL